MATSKEYLTYILEGLSEAEGITYRPMMGEYVLYSRGKVIGGIYDDRFLVKVTPSVAALLPAAARVIPYDGAKEMLLIEETEDRVFLRELIDALYADLPAPKKRSGK